VPPANLASVLRGVLNPRVGLTKFSTTQRAPAPKLTPFVDHYWLTSWDLRGEPDYEQQVIPSPCVHLVVAPDYALVHGVMTGRFTKLLSGRAHVVGVRFRPAGCQPFLGAPLSTITGRSLPVEQVFGPSALEVTHALRATEDRDEQVAITDAFLLGHRPPRDPTAETVSDLVDRVVSDTGITRVDQLAGEAGVSVRRLQRLFAHYVGVGPKWVIRRHRIHEAAGRAAQGAAVDWAEFAAELGYSDQAHFTRDFTGTVGLPPVRYARSCAGQSAPRARRAAG
jgi:AraC-like DNA-binding protein